ncbi:MAG: EamA family transporter [Verrucomicrobia bacterium]|nr:EamA family transporter [Verrucomicrobiota bacterium]
MHFPAHLFLPLASSLVYVAAVLLVKRSAAYGVGLWRTTFVSNVTMGVCFAPLWLLGGPGQPVGAYWQPVLSGALFFLGQIFTFMALQRGDVSVATPVLGLKVVLVVFFSVSLLAGTVSLHVWLAAGLSTLGIALLSRGGRPAHHAAGRTIFQAAVAAASFAASDVLVQKWTPAWGVGRFLPLMFGVVMVLSAGFVPFFSAPLRLVPRAAWPWLLGGAVALAVQAANMAVTLGVFGDATTVNIVYASRGLWSVLAVWLVGHWFRNEEGGLDAAILRSRLMGAGLMLAAIALAVT